jgi:hypothetical protein
MESKNLKRGREEEPSPSPSSRSVSEGEDGRVDSESSSTEDVGEPSPPKRMRRRASIFPGSKAYNEAILASFEAVLLEDLASPNASSSSDDNSDDNSQDT